MFAVLFNKCFCFCCPRLNPFVFNCGSFYSLSAKISRNENQKISTDTVMPVAVLYYYYTLHGESAEEPKKPQETPEHRTTTTTDRPIQLHHASPRSFLEVITTPVHSFLPLLRRSPLHYLDLIVFVVVVITVLFCCNQR